MLPLKIVEKKNLWFTLSLLPILVGFGLMGYRYLNSMPVLNFGIDFSGGSTLNLKFANHTDTLSLITELRKTLKSIGLEQSSIQISDQKEVLIKTNLLDHAGSENILKTLREQMGQVEVLEIDFIGPSMGSELRQKSLWIVFIAVILLLIYITWRFEFSYGISAIIATLHDGLITISIASIFLFEINTEFVAALLTILGFSIMDTIVIFDRIRENVNHIKKMEFSSLVNLSLHQTWARTFNTTGTTLGAIVCLVLFGGATIKAFCLILLVGVVAGAYSSPFVAAPLLTLFHKEQTS